jgi:putative nucleotidyltransferase with HDIG domain
MCWRVFVISKKVVSIFEDIIGEKIAEDIYDQRGNFLISKDTVIDQHICDKLIKLGCYDIPVYSTEENIDSSREILKKDYDEDINSYKKILNKLSSKQEMDNSTVESLSDSILNKLDNSFLVEDCLNQIRSKDEYTYTHSVNVSLYAMLTARWLKLNEKQIKDVSQAGILHDIGKTKLPDSIINKAETLSSEEYDEFKKHAVIGYNISKKIKGINKDISEAILMHHENIDGTGYPLGIKGDKIHLYAKILSVANLYDTLISGKGKTPFETFQELEKIGYGKLDTKILLTFLENIADHYIGTKVKLNTGETGKIVHIPSKSISKPIIKVGEKIIKLANNDTYSIAEIV